MQIRNVSFDELPEFVRKGIEAGYKKPLFVKATVFEFSFAPSLYEVCVLDLDRNVIAEVTFEEGAGVRHESTVMLGTVVEALKKYPERFGLE
ncbi:hypothetical protein SAMN05192569_108222 [Parageobacillus thermantarcticus]|uniref:Uncharacterized protein n=2 Tax=Parageobacillus thermantarcticus TaxID=186116 RepID=A0A1I0SEQ5_9BACL|nr:hypothetical protein [Parageobacillus thermantarcticus]SFA37988.1 hypothetical protein SAMN05192569_10011 [Parageobacillus thermantarcticus]SFA56916.1 hypothetical protein SAMN05192569_108222 [Parageobacillus thermantarcticus]